MASEGKMTGGGKSGPKKYNKIMGKKPPPGPKASRPPLCFSMASIALVETRGFPAATSPTDAVAVARPPPTAQSAVRPMATRASRQRATAARRLSVFRYSQCDVDDDGEWGVGCGGEMGGGGGITRQAE